MLIERTVEDEVVKGHKMMVGGSDVPLPPSAKMLTLSSSLMLSPHRAIIHHTIRRGCNIDVHRQCGLSLDSVESVQAAYICY
jgi:hypothetical protein